MIFIIDFDGYYIVRTDEAQPRPKYIFHKCGSNIYFFFTLPSPFLLHHHRRILNNDNNYNSNNNINRNNDYENNLE